MYKKRKVFSPPEKSELILYFLEIGLADDSELEAEKFIDLYESKGWKVGKSPMNNWKAAARNWKKNLGKFNAENTSTSSQNDRNSNSNPPADSDKIGRVSRSELEKFANTRSVPGSRPIG